MACAIIISFAYMESGKNQQQIFQYEESSIQTHVYWVPVVCRIFCESAEFPPGVITVVTSSAIQWNGHF